MQYLLTIWLIQLLFEVIKGLVLSLLQSSNPRWYAKIKSTQQLQLPLHSAVSLWSLVETWTPKCSHITVASSPWHWYYHCSWVSGWSRFPSIDWGSFMTVFFMEKSSSSVILLQPHLVSNTCYLQVFLIIPWPYLMIHTHQLPIAVWWVWVCSQVRFFVPGVYLYVHRSAKLDLTRPNSLFFFSNLKTPKLN